MPAKTPRRISFDSNAWEKVFTAGDQTFAPIRAALSAGDIQGFICEASFRIEAIMKRQRDSYFAEPGFRVAFNGVVEQDGQSYLHITMGPDDALHPGLPAVQAERLCHAFATGVRLMRGQNWMGLPGVLETRDPSLFVREDEETCHHREYRQIEVSAEIDGRGVGNAAFEAAGGWAGAGKATDRKRFYRACAEWSDGELAAAHVAYGNDILCTDDRAAAGGSSIFDPTNRRWLAEWFGVEFMTLQSLLCSLET